MALPTPRQIIVAAKFVVTVLWIVELTVLIFALGLGIGAAIGLEDWSIGLGWTSFWTMMITVFLTLLLMPCVAWFASAGRGYLPPLASPKWQVGWVGALGFRGPCPGCLV